MRRDCSSLAAGLLFGAGLTISRMIDPRKVLDFLDLFGHWDPSLALVMGSALLVTATLFRIALRRPHPLFGAEFHLPRARPIDARLIYGSALFGSGWGLAGFCPGPAVASLAYGLWPSVLFVVSMVGGMALWECRNVAGRALSAAFAPVATPARRS